MNKKLTKNKKKYFAQKQKYGNPNRGDQKKKNKSGVI